jgi:hypothetical protein
MCRTKFEYIWCIHCQSRSSVSSGDRVKPRPGNGRYSYWSCSVWANAGRDQRTVQFLHQTANLGTVSNNKLHVYSWLTYRIDWPTSRSRVHGTRVHYLIQNSPPLVLIVRQIHPVHTYPSWFFNIHIPSHFPQQNPACKLLLSHVCHILNQPYSLYMFLERYN